MRNIIVLVVITLSCLAASVVQVNSEAFFIPKFFLSAPPTTSSSTRPRHVNPRLKVSSPSYRQVKSYGGNGGHRNNYPVSSYQKPGYRQPQPPVRAPLRQPYAAARPVSKPVQQPTYAQQPQKLDYSGWTPIGFDENAPISQGSKYQDVDLVTLDVAIANAPAAQTDDYSAPHHSNSPPPPIITDQPSAPIANSYSPPATNSYSPPASNSYSAPVQKNPVQISSSYGAPVPAVPYIQSTAEQAASISKPKYRPNKPTYNKPTYNPKPSYKPVTSQPKPQYVPFQAEPAVPTKYTKPTYNAPSPSPAPQYSAPAPSAAPQYKAPAAPAYSAPAPAPQYSAPAPAPAPQYSAPAPAPQYSAPAPAPQYSAPAAPPAYQAPSKPSTYSAPAPVPQYSAPAVPPAYEAPAPAQPTGLYNAPNTTPKPSYLPPQSKSIKYAPSTNIIKSEPTKAPVILPSYTPAPPPAQSYDPLSFGDEEFPIISLITGESNLPEEDKYVSFTIGSESNYQPQYESSNALTETGPEIEDPLQDELYYIYYQDPVNEEEKSGYGKRNIAKEVEYGDVAPAHDIPLYDYDEAEIDLLRQPRQQNQQEYYLSNYRNIGGHSSVSVNFDVGGTNQGYSFHLNR